MTPEPCPCFEETSTTLRRRFSTSAAVSCSRGANRLTRPPTIPHHLPALSPPAALEDTENTEGTQRIQNEGFRIFFVFLRVLRGFPAFLCASLYPLAAGGW